MHTAPLEAAPAVVGALLATNGEVTIGVGLSLLFGISYHLSGYSMNSYTDWADGFDKEDPNKQNHPLNTGDVSPRAALVVILNLFLLTIVTAYLLARGSKLALTILLIGVLFGIAYNKLGKLTKFKFIFISIAHSTVFVIPYISLGGDVSDQTFLVLTAFVFTWVLYQIMIEGDIKDLEQDEANLLQDLGCYVTEKNYAIISAKAQFLSLIVNSAKIVLAMTVLFMGIERAIVDILVLITVTGLLIYMSLIAGRLTSTGPYQRHKRVKQMSIIEFTTLTIFVLTASVFIGFIQSLVIIVSSAVWIITLNKVQWNTVIAPRV